MMNKQTYLRLNAITKIRNTIRLIEKAGKEIDYAKLLIEIQAEYGVSQRTAKEYIDVADSQHELQST